MESTRKTTTTYRMEGPTVKEAILCSFIVMFTVFLSYLLMDKTIEQAMIGGLLALMFVWSVAYICASFTLRRYIKKQ